MNTQYEFGEFVLDPAEGRLSKGEGVIRLTPRLLTLLTVLVERQGRLVEKQELLERVWGGTFVSEANITVQMSRLRRLLGETEAEPFIETVPTRGYRFLVPVRARLVDHDRTTDLNLPSAPPGSGLDRVSSSSGPGLDRVWTRSESDPDPISKAGSIGADPISAAGDAEVGKSTKSVTIAVWRRSKYLWRLGLATSALILAGLVVWFAPSPRSSASAPAGGDRTRLTSHLADDGEPALSPDGRTLAFISNRAGQPELYVMDLDSGDPPRRISPSIAAGPAWSPDGTHLAFVCIRTGQADICVVDRDATKERVVVSAAGDDIQPAWAPDSARIAFVRTSGRQDQVFMTDASGGAPAQQVTPADWSAHSPHWSPDGRRLVVVRQMGDENVDLAVIDADGTHPVALTSGPTSDIDPVWAPDGGRIAFARDQGIVAFETADGSLTPVEGTRAGDRHPTWSPDGQWVVFQSGRDGNSEIYRSRVPGARLTRRLTESLAADQDPAWSPDGSRIAFASNRDGRHEIYVMKADGSGVERLTTNDARDLKPAWSPDGRRLAFMREIGGHFDIYVIDVATKAEQLLAGTPGDDSEPSWSPDGTRLAFNSASGGNFDIYVMGLDGGAPVNLTAHPARDTYPSWSPDGRAIVFASNRDSTHFADNNLLILDLETKQTRKITDGPPWDAFPVWSRSGRIAFVRSIGNRHDIVLFDVSRGVEVALTLGGPDEDGPTWSPDGRQVAYFSNRAGNADIYVRDAPP